MEYALLCLILYTIYPNTFAHSVSLHSFVLLQLYNTTAYESLDMFTYHQVSNIRRALVGN